MKYSGIYLALGLIWAFSPAAHAGNYRGLRSGYAKDGAAMKGLASWYNERQRTASGEMLDRHAFTAAHRTLPLGTVVAVKNLNNGREVTVKINDRGPYIRGRIIDLSEAAARKLDLIHSGVAPVEVRILRKA